MADLLTIGEVARRAGVAASALRFYEQNRLLEPAARVSNGRRLYAPDAVEKVEVILYLADVGFAIAEITELLESPPSSPHAWKRLVERKIAELDGRLQRVRTTRDALKQALDDPDSLVPAIIKGVE